MRGRNLVEKLAQLEYLSAAMTGTLVDALDRVRVEKGNGRHTVDGTEAGQWHHVVAMAANDHGLDIPDREPGFR